jgi:hypothetical protein
MKTRAPEADLIHYNLFVTAGCPRYEAETSIATSPMVSIPMIRRETIGFNVYSQ